VHQVNTSKRQVVDLGKQVPQWSASGDEDDALLVGAVELLIVGEFGIQDEMPG
jgi:hypothetical protein